MSRRSIRRTGNPPLLPARARLFTTLEMARGDGRYARLLNQLARVDLPILDDWGPELLLPNLPPALNPRLLHAIQRLKNIARHHFTQQTANSCRLRTGNARIRPAISRNGRQRLASTYAFAAMGPWIQLLLEQLLDEPAHPLPDGCLDRVRPSVSPKQRRVVRIRLHAIVPDRAVCASARTPDMAR